MRYRRLWESELWSILLIINARGPSLPSYRLERLPVQHLRREPLPRAQITIITFLIILYSPIPNKLKSSRLLMTPSPPCAPPTPSASYQRTPSHAPLATLPLSLISKFPQIRQNAHAQSTGQLSAFAVVPQVLGCLARVFTAQEVGDPLVQSSLLLALILNTVLAAQMYMYWGKHEERKVLGRLGRGSVRSRIPSEKREHWRIV
ncbi:hypothetical protein D9611_014279 [Ephemerocybe angulata]|uniref:Uncharacterized protein n=1 Tax=Ephemerocybe angulata TaxID=980116 RepID=A0A8H5BTS3_9AGAR|nr:hypothetical protein D9611_014279 [Tulosesus angulatus]